VSAVEPPSEVATRAGFAAVARRQVVVLSPTIHFRLRPGDRALVAPGDTVVPGLPIAERTPDARLVHVGRLAGPSRNSSHGADGEASPVEPTPAGNASSPASLEGDGRRPPLPGEWWAGGGERRRMWPRGKPTAPVGGTLLFESGGRWLAAAAARHQIVESPVAGIVREARNAVEVTIEATGAALTGALAAGEPSRGHLDVPRLADGELWASALDVGRSGAVVVAGSRISAQAISRARAVSIHGLVAGSVGQGDLRDFEASEMRQSASLVETIPFGLIALDGNARRPIPTPILTLLAALVGREVAIVTNPPLLVFDAAAVPLPDLPSDWIRVRSGQHAGREGRWLEPGGLRRFRSGIYLEAAVVRLGGDTEPTVVPVSDLERFTFQVQVP